MFKSKILGHFLFSSLILSGCNPDSGGSSSSVGSSNAVGLYSGTTSTSRSIDGLILSDGTYYFLYSYINTPSLIGGVVQGNSSSSAGTFTSSNAVDFSIEGYGVMTGTIDGVYAEKKTLNGTIFYNTGGSASYSATYDSNFENTPSLSDLAGTFTGDVAFSLGFEGATLTISSSGSISGFGASGCAVYGSVAPRSDGNVYDLIIKFGDTPCYFANQKMSGIGYYDADKQQLWAATPNASRTEIILFVGSKS